MSFKSLNLFLYKSIYYLINTYKFFSTYAFISVYFKNQRLFIASFFLSHKTIFISIPKKTITSWAIKKRIQQLKMRLNLLMLIFNSLHFKIKRINSKIIEYWKNKWNCRDKELPVRLAALLSNLYHNHSYFA